MANGIKISVASDTRDFARGVKTGLVAPLEDASTTIKTLTRDGVAGEAKLVDAFKLQQRATQANEAEYKTLSRTVQTESRAQAHAVQETTEEAAGHAKETIQEVKGEALQNAAETLSSFDGSAQSVISGVQGTFGGLAASLGPIGIAIAAAGALGVGALNTQLQKADADAAQTY